MIIPTKHAVRALLCLSSSALSIALVASASAQEASAAPVSVTSATPQADQTAPIGQGASTTPTDTAPGAPGQEADGMGTDIIVTAQFRRERVQDTGLTVLARDGDFLERRQVANARDLAVNIPGFQVGGTYQAAPQYSIRGTRSSTIDIASEDSIAVYFDGVYVARPAASTLDLYELERVEVLKGPQGTLYGRNAVGGVINYIAPEPFNGYSGRLTAEVGNYDARYFRGRVNVPLVADTVFANAAFSIRNRSGYVRNLTNGHDLSDEDSVAVRGALKWVASDALNVVVRGDYNRSKNAGPGFSSMRQTTARTIITPGQPPRAIEVPWFDPTSTDPLLNPTGWVITDIHQSLQNFDGVEKRTTYGFSATASGESDAFNMVAIGAYRYLFSDQLSDVDGTPCIAAPTNFLASANVAAFAPGNPDLLGPPRCITLNDTVTVPFLLNRTVPQAFGMNTNSGFATQRTDHAKQYSQELRLLSTPGGVLTFDDRLTWVLGGLAFYENARRDQFDTSFGVTNVRKYFAQSKALSLGVYSQASLRVVEGVNLIGGLRYSYDRKRFFFSQVNRPLTAVLASSGGRPVLVSPLDFSPTVEFSNLPGIFGFPTGFPNPALTNGTAICPVGTRCLPLTRTQKSWTSLDPKIGFEVRPRHDILIYGSYTQGYKGGGFASTPEDLATGLTPYDPERIKAYELGIKTGWFGGKLTANLALFRNNSKDVQIQSGYDHDNNPGTKPFVGVRNAAGLRAQGIEAELSARPLRGLLLYSNYAYTDAKFRDFLVFGGGVVVADNSGNRPIGQPVHALNAGLDVSTPISDGWVGQANVDVSYRSKVFFNESNFSEAVQKGYSLVNGSVAIRQESNGLEARLWVRNVFNKDYLTHILSTGAGRVPLLGSVINAGAYALIPGTPRTYGVSVSWTFGN